VNNLNYNAETGWNALGTGLFGGQGAFDESMQPKYRRVFESIEGEPIRKQPNFLDEDLLSDAINNFSNVRNSFGGPENFDLLQKALDGAVSTIGTSFGDNAIGGIQNALAGKFFGLI